MNNNKSHRYVRIATVITSIVTILAGLFWTVISIVLFSPVSSVIGLAILAAGIVQIVFFARASSKNNADTSAKAQAPGPLTELYPDKNKKRPPVNYIADSESAFCPYCGSVAEPDFKYCNVCGKEIP